jgi:cyclohexyl-isocyanide hydratase
MGIMTLLPSSVHGKSARGCDATLGAADMSADPTPCHIGFLIFPQMTQIDFTEPYEVFARLPDTCVHVVARTADPVRSDRGLVIVPSVTCEQCAPLDVLVVPGGPGTRHVVEDDAALGFLSRQAEQAAYVTSVCTGALVLGAAGLLAGYRATTHWLSMPLLELYDAIPVRERVVVDRNRVTAGGCTAGLDFAFRLAAMLRGETIAQRIQLQLEYNPAPPFNSGSPTTAPQEVIDAVRHAAEPLQQLRWKAASQWRSDRLAAKDSTALVAKSA